MVCLGLLYSIGLYIVGLDTAFLIGMIAGLVSIVPYLGFIVGIFSATIASFIQFHDWWHFIGVLLVFLIAQSIEGSVLTPWLVGDKVGLHPVLVIFAVLAGGSLFGFVGVLLAIPVTAVIMVFIRYFKMQYFNSRLYSL
jgi:predicted PurR-regulated permease PerM